MDAKRFMLFAVLFAAGVGALVASVEVGRRITDIDGTLSQVAADLKAHVDAGGGTSVDGDAYGASLEVVQMNNLAWRHELVLRLWSLRVGGPLVALIAVIGMGMALVGRNKPRGGRRSRPGRKTAGRKRPRPRRKRPAQPSG